MVNLAFCGFFDAAFYDKILSASETFILIHSLFKDVYYKRKKFESRV